MRNTILIALTILAVIAGALPYACAFTSDRVSFNNRYKTSGTVLDTCMTCHKAKSSRKNPYGSDYKRAGYALQAIEGEDSDGDGFANITEINAGTFPGDARSKPPPATNLPTVYAGSDETANPE